MSPSEIKQDGENSLAMEDRHRRNVTGIEGSAVCGDPGVVPEMASKDSRPDGMEDGRVLPPGQHPYDPVNKDIDPVGKALERVQTFLLWIEEHLASFEKLRHTDSEDAESELSNLRDSTEQGIIYLQRLSELVLAGYTLDPDKRLPESLSRGWFSCRAKQLLDRNKAMKTKK